MTSAVDMKFLQDLEVKLHALEERLRYYADLIVCEGPVTIVPAEKLPER